MPRLPALAAWKRGLHSHHPSTLGRWVDEYRPEGEAPAPTSTSTRRAYVAKESGGFVYYVAVTGITGAKLSDIAGVRQNVFVEASRPEDALQLDSSASGGTRLDIPVRELPAALNGESVKPLPGLRPKPKNPISELSYR